MCPPTRKDTSQHDLDDYNNDTEDGLHVTSMAGTWMSIVKGFAGMRVIGDKLSFKPHLPPNWESYNFKINFRGHLLTVSIHQGSIQIRNSETTKLDLIINETNHTINANDELVVTNKA